MSEICKFTYAGTAPIGDSETYVLFSSVVAFNGKRMASHFGLSRLVADVKHSQNGTFKLSKSLDRGVTWHQVDSVAVTETTNSDIYDALIEEYDDFKLEWVNAGVAQATWAVDIALVNARAAAV